MAVFPCSPPHRCKYISIQCSCSTLDQSTHILTFTVIMLKILSPFLSFCILFLLFFPTLCSHCPLSLFTARPELFLLYLPPSLSLLAVMICCLGRVLADRDRQGRGRTVKACYSFLPSLWHVWRMEGDLELV